jgi:hypothetical protein
MTNPIFEEASWKRRLRDYSNGRLRGELPMFDMANPGDRMQWKRSIKTRRG